MRKELSDMEDYAIHMDKKDKETMMNKLLKTSELCSLLGVTRQCVYKWRQLESPIPVAINNTSNGGKTIRYNYKDVMDWLNSNGKEEKVLRAEEN